MVNIARACRALCYKDEAVPRCYSERCVVENHRLVPILGLSREQLL